MEKLINQYLCPGCASGISTKDECYKSETVSDTWKTCANHHPGTFELRAGNFYLGMPKGFCRTGKLREDGKFVPVWIIPKEGGLVPLFDVFNVPVWKTKDKGNTLVRGLRPRINQPFLMVLEGQEHFDEIKCFEVTKELQKDMD